MNGPHTQLSGREQVLAYLRETVLPDPELQGTFVSEQKIATDVGVSRTPVREALLILSSENLVQLQPKRGAYISPLSGREISELMDLRGVLERHAASRSIALAARQPFEEMDNIIIMQTDMSEKPDERRAKEFIEMDRRFHQEMVDAAGNELLSRTYASLRERQIRVGISALRLGPVRWTSVCREHRDILLALQASNVEAAHVAIDFHLKTTLQSLLTV